MASEDSYTEKLYGYLRLAEEARRSALKTKHPQVKQSFEAIAASWQQLAEQVAQIASAKNKS